MDFLDTTFGLPNNYWDIGTTGTHTQSEFVSKIKVGSKFGDLFGSGGGGSTPGYGVYDGAVQGGPYGSA